MGGGPSLAFRCVHLRSPTKIKASEYFNSSYFCKKRRGRGRWDGEREEEKGANGRTVESKDAVILSLVIFTAKDDELVVVEEGCVPCQWQGTAGVQQGFNLFKSLPRRVRRSQGSGPVGLDCEGSQGGHRAGSNGMNGVDAMTFNGSGPLPMRLARLSIWLEFICKIIYGFLTWQASEKAPSLSLSRLSAALPADTEAPITLSIQSKCRPRNRLETRCKLRWRTWVGPGRLRPGCQSRRGRGMLPRPTLISQSFSFLLYQSKL